VSDETSHLILEARDLVATTRKLRASYHAGAAQYIAENTQLCIKSRDAIARSVTLITKHREGAIGRFSGLRAPPGP
jgi:hypothetical protein